MAAAQQACAALRPTGGFGAGAGGAGGAGGLNSPANAAYRTCLQQHGVTLPTTGAGSTPPSSFDRNNTAFAAANAACASLRARPTTTTT